MAEFARGLFLLALLTPARNYPALAIKGSFDASGAAEGILPLAGEWELVEDIRPEHPRYEALPCAWPEVSGWRAYRLVARGLDPALVYALKITYMDSSYRLYVDGDLAASGGQPGRSAAESRPSYAPTILRLPTGASET